MEALILYCSTGGGHNAAAKAVQDALSRQGHHAILLDPYSLQGQAVADKVGRFYVDFVRTVPRLFGVVYKLGEAYTKLQEHLPHHSPVYLFQRKTARTLKQYLEKSQPDVIVTTHVFAGEMLTMLRNEGMKLPPVIYIATDYTSIPFTQEVQADRYIVGHKDIVQSFVAAGLPEWKILPYGIPVNEAFQSRMSRPDACRWLGLDPAKRHILLSGGSMGFGLDGMIRTLLPVLEEHPDTVLLVLTGSNEELQKSIHEKYPGPQIRALGPTDQMPRYLQACQVLITKPGGLSTTEACVSQIPMVLVHPIPGVETINARFFESHAMARWARDPEQDLADILREVLADPAPMEQAQATLQSNAALRTASLCSSLVRRKG
ncbi:MGDG synthase family glycosyltransferase [Faecalibaculum rodentium]|uniref:MGDG synthase family glycosyltransferase n=1 Tax=Faecalibaculum rodentium TaxID=1702221 RepID=UPI002493D0B5|nr:glycosyltransferase [Faecalibaculum rodentium]